MGPEELEPPFPKFPWLDLPQEKLLVVKMYQATTIFKVSKATSIRRIRTFCTAISSL